MNQTTMQSPLAVLILILAAAVAVLAVVTVFLFRKLAVLEKSEEKMSAPAEAVLKPFSEPRPGPEPVPPVLVPAMPVVPVADPNIRPARYAYDQRYFERFYAPCRGSVLAVQVQVNDRVEKGDVLLRLQLENAETELRASASGTLRELNCKAGASFRKDELLYVIQ